MTLSRRDVKDYSEEDIAAKLDGKQVRLQLSNNMDVYGTDEGWTYAALESRDKNTDSARRHWIVKRVGRNLIELALIDGRTWYVN